MRRRKCAASWTACCGPQLTVRVEVPAVEDSQPVAYVAQGDDEVHSLFHRFGRSPPSSDPNPVVVHEADLLLRVSSKREGKRTGLMPASKAISVARAARWPERTDEKVARASTRVPAAVAAEAAVAQSIVAQSIIDVSCHPEVEIEEPGN